MKKSGRRTSSKHLARITTKHGDAQSDPGVVQCDRYANRTPRVVRTCVSWIILHTHYSLTPLLFTRSLPAKSTKYNRPSVVSPSSSFRCDFSFFPSNSCPEQKKIKKRLCCVRKKKMKNSCQQKKRKIVVGKKKRYLYHWCL